MKEKKTIYPIAIILLFLLRSCNTHTKDDALHYFSEIEHFNPHEIDTIYNTGGSCDNSYFKYFHKVSDKQYVEIRWSKQKNKMIGNDDTIFKGQAIFIDKNIECMYAEFTRHPFSVKKRVKKSFTAPLTKTIKAKNGNNILIYTDDTPNVNLGKAFTTFYVNEKIGIFLCKAVFPENVYYNNETVSLSCKDSTKNAYIKGLLNNVK